MSTPSATTKVWFITGASSGFGRALAEAALTRGDRVAATARQPEQLTDLLSQYPERGRALRLDVNRADEVTAAVTSASTTFGRIDIVVNNAGYGLLAGVEEASEQQIRDQFETNVFGLLNVTRAVLPVLRRQGSGHILQISSVGGQLAFPGLGIYNATKWAVEGLSEALAAEVTPHGIKVTIIEPGGFNTEWAGRSMVHAAPMPEYASSTSQFRQMLATIDRNHLGDPRAAAQAMLQLADLAEPPLRLPLGQDALYGIREKLMSQQAELERWAALSLLESIGQS